MTRRLLVTSGRPRSAKVILMNDRQNVVNYQRSILRTCIDYVLARQPDLVVIVGDVTDASDRGDGTIGWQNIAAELPRLTAAGIKWLLSTGNHDYTSFATRATEINAYIPVPPWCTPREPGHIESTYSRISLCGRQYLFLVLEWSPRDATLAWANQVARQFADLPVILLTHAYTYADGTRYDWATKGETQAHSPHWWPWVTTPEQGINDGEEIWQKLVRDNPNIKFVFSGHMNPAWAWRVVRRSGGSPCFEAVSNFQAEERFDDGWHTELDFDHNNGMLRARAYSPFLCRSRITNSLTFRQRLLAGPVI